MRFFSARSQSGVRPTHIVAGSLLFLFVLGLVAMEFTSSRAENDPNASAKEETQTEAVAVSAVSPPVQISDVETLLRELRNAPLADAAAVSPYFDQLASKPDRLMQSFSQALAENDQVLAVQLAFQLRENDALSTQAANIAVNAIKTGDTMERLLAVECAGLIGVDHAQLRAALKESLNDNDLRVRYRAVAALGRMKNPSEETVATLQEVLDDQSPLIAVRAEKSIAEVKRTAPLLAARLETPPAEKQVARASLTPPAHANKLSHQAQIEKDDKALVSDLKSHDGKRKAEAAMLAALRTHPDEALVQALADSLHDPDERVRFAASFALGQIGAPALPVLGKAITDKDPKVRLKAVQALKVVQPFSSEIVSTLLPALRDEDETIRFQTALALVPMQPANAEALQTLIQLLGTDFQFVDASAPVLRKADAAIIVPAILPSLSASDPVTRSGAARALSAVGPAAAPAVSSLKELLKDPVESVQRSAATALKEIDAGSDSAPATKPEK